MPSVFLKYKQYFERKKVNASAKERQKEQSAAWIKVPYASKSIDIQIYRLQLSLSFHKIFLENSLKYLFVSNFAN